MSIVQHNLDLLGAILTVIFYCLSILIFVFRLCGKPHFGYWLGILMFVFAVPLIYLLIKAPELHRPSLYYVQIGLMLLWMSVALLLDYILKISFRQIKWMVNQLCHSILCRHRRVAGHSLLGRTRMEHNNDCIVPDYGCACFCSKKSDRDVAVVK